MAAGPPPRARPSCRHTPIACPPCVPAPPPYLRRRPRRPCRAQGFELPKALYVESAAFSVENDLVTPTFKLRRPQLLKKYTEHVDTMYATFKQRGAA